MFNILIKFDGTSWETDQLMRMDLERFKEYSGTEAENIFANKPTTLKVLEGIDTLLMCKKGAEGPSADLVRYGYLHDIKIVGRELVLRFEEKGTYARIIIEEFAKRLGIGFGWEFNRTHWAIKDASIPRDMRARLIPSYDVVFLSQGRTENMLSRSHLSCAPKTLRSSMMNSNRHIFGVKIWPWRAFPARYGRRNRTVQEALGSSVQV
jgi:hypothetical protein